jgi:transcriptional regulator with XRE-family HTH domain
MNWSDTMDNIGPRVKALRISKRLNQQELADRCGVSQPAINKIETGKTKTIKGYVLEALSKELSTTTTYILKGSESADTLEHDMMMAEMSAIFRDLPLSDKEMLLRMARGILPAKKAAKTANSH